MNFEKPRNVVKEYLPDITLPEYHSTGVIHNDAAVLTDSSSYAILRTVPYEPITETTIGLTPAWWTSTRGHNRHTLEHYMRLGVPGVAVGIEGSYRHGSATTLTTRIRELSKITLASSAHNIHSILNTIDDRYDNTHTQTSDMILLGESRGAMIGQGIIATAASYQRNIFYADLTAPCFPASFSLKKAPNLMKQIVKEPVEFAKIFGSISLRSLLHYPATIDLHPTAVLHNVAIGPALFSGEAGELASRVPLEQQMHITTFHDDFASMPDMWDQIYANHENVRIKRIEGAHLTIAHPRTLEYIDRRIFALLFEVEHIGSKNPKDLNFAHVHLDDA